MSRAEQWSSTRPRIFIGSAAEDLGVAGTFEALLADFSRPRLWNRTFVVGRSFIDDILLQAAQCEFGLFVMTPRDLELMRDDLSMVPRDNVLLELGVFLGALGKGRALFVYAGDDQPRLPTDLAGMTAGIWRAAPTVDEALAPVAASIAEAVGSHLPMTPLGANHDNVEGLARAMVSRVSRALGCHPDDIGVHVWWRDEGDGLAEPVLRRVVRERSGSSPWNDWPPWRAGQGVVGLAWSTNETAHLDLADADLQSVDDSAAFERLPAERRLGLAYEDFLTTRRDFRAVWATPVQHPATHAKLAVVSVNIDRDVRTPFGELNAVVRPALREFAQVTGALALSG